MATGAQRDEERGGKNSRPLAIPPAPRRGLNRVEAAAYVGLSPSKFDQLVDDGRMPGPKRIDGRKVWDVRALDIAFDELPCEDEAANSWDRLLR